MNINKKLLKYFEKKIVFSLHHAVSVDVRQATFVVK